MALITPEIKTERLLLRAIKSADVTYVFEALSNPCITQYYAVSFSSLEETQPQMKFYQDLLESETGMWWALCSPDNERFYGACGINNRNVDHKKAEVGYWLLPQFHGMGYVSEALKSICAYCFQDLKLIRLEALIESDNLTSIRTAIKAGFKFECRFREVEQKNNTRINLDFYGLLKPME